MDMTRRQLVGGALASMVARAPAAGESPLDPADPARRLAVIERMRGGPSGAALWWYSGTFFGKPEGEMTRPLLRIDGASHVSFVPDGPGRFRSEMNEAGFFSDLETGERLDRWRNPLNGRLVTPEHYRSSGALWITADAVEPVAALPPAVEFEGRMTPLVVHGGSAWVSEELFVRSPVPGTARPSYRVQTSLATFHCRLSELADAAVDFVPCELSYSTLASWRPWMEMGDRPGVISWRLVGQKLRRFDELPNRTARWIRANHPALRALMESTS